jgi:hypothetical protein
MAYTKILFPTLILFLASSYLSAVTVLFGNPSTQKMTVNLAFSLFIGGIALVIIWGLPNTPSLNPDLEK